MPYTASDCRCSRLLPHFAAYIASDCRFRCHLTASDVCADAADSDADAASSSADILKWGLAVYRSAGINKPSPAEDF